MGSRVRGGLRQSRPRQGDRAALVAITSLTLAVLGGFFLVDPRAEAAFDAPKRLGLLLAVTVAAAALVLGGRRTTRRRWQELPRSARYVAATGGAVLALATVAAVLSPRQPAALAALRVLLLVALLVPLGASRALARRGAAVLVAAFVAAASLSALLAIAQAAGAWQPLTVESITGRTANFALVGNEGVLGLALALAATISLGIAWRGGDRRSRALAAVALVPLLAGLAATASLTALAALLSASAVLLVLGAPRRALVGIAGLAVAAGLVASLPPVTSRLREAVTEARAGGLGALLSGRLGPWAAATEMVRERPLVGFGPGTFAAEFVPHRLKAELRHHVRYTNPKLESSYGQVHNEPLQAAAELGVGAAGLAIVSAGTLLLALRRRLRDLSGPAHLEGTVVLAVLAAGVVSSLAWFPLQVGATAAPLLLAAGRGWRLLLPLEEPA